MLSFLVMYHLSEIENLSLSSSTSTRLNKKNTSSSGELKQEELCVDLRRMIVLPYLRKNGERITNLPQM